MSTEVSGHEKYYIPEKSSIPIIFAAATLFVGYGAANAVVGNGTFMLFMGCLLYTSPSPRDGLLSRMPSSA